MRHRIHKNTTSLACACMNVCICIAFALYQAKIRAPINNYTDQLFLRVKRIYSKLQIRIKRDTCLNSIKLSLLFNFVLGYILKIIPIKIIFNHSNPPRAAIYFSNVEKLAAKFECSNLRHSSVCCTALRRIP